MKVIAIAPGHYSSYSGVVKNNFSEYDEVRIIVEYLKTKFDPKEYTVHVVEGALKDKVVQINELNPDLAVEVHLANTNSTKIEGSRAFFMLNEDSSKRLAESLLESCVRMLGTYNQGAWIGWYKKISPTMVEKGKAPADWKAKIDLILSKTVCPTAIIEPFYISSPRECTRFIAGKKHDFIADSLSDGIKRYFELNSAN